MLYAIGPWAFPTKKAAQEYTVRLRDKYANSELIIGQDDEFLRNLVNQHPEAAAKVGGGIHHFTVESAGPWGSRHFVLHRQDRTSTDFSYRACFAKPTHRSQVYAALRTAVADQVLAFRDRMFSRGQPTCSLTGKKLIPEETHVDHIYPFTFSAIVEHWLHSTGYEVGTLQVIPSQDNQQVHRLKDADKEQSFAEFHQQYAKYRLLDCKVNMHLSNKAAELTVAGPRQLTKGTPCST